MSRRNETSEKTLDGKVVYMDSEVNDSMDTFKPTLKRQMKDRHIAMISIGGVIGTGLFLGTATGLQTGGPVGLLLAYIVIGSICYAVMVTLGEMVSYLPVPGGHLTLAERFVDPAFSFALGWNYWYNWTVILPAELSAAAVIINYWNDTVNDAVWITVFFLVVICINILGAGAYGEAEFVFASIKVVTIVGLIILGIVIDLGGGPNHDRLGFRYWKNPGPFVQYHGIAGAKGRFLAFAASLTQAAFSFIGTEIVAIAGAEVKNPRRNIPRAIKGVYIRLLLFYIGGVAIIGLLVPYTEPQLSLKTSDAAKSPFVIAIKNAGIQGLPSVINAALLTSAWSAASSDLYCSSRAIYGLAASGNAPKIFLKVTRHGLPWVAIIFQSLFGLLAYMGLKEGPGRVFGWFGNMTSIAGLMSWFGICITYLRFRQGLQVQGIDRKSLPYNGPGQPYLAWYGAILSLFVCFISGWTNFIKGNWATDQFVTNYMPFVLFPFLYIAARIWKHASLIPPMNMDFKTGLDEIEAASHDEAPPRNWLERAWNWLM
ncbi:hypothetical protein QCA50_019526 [Cerrena zonata]|uniref:Amino acid permease/ SLC12A domain-containing protein n=1 Tax=Cerrena zonata TaxID=2478898 RepID=A0AAW0F917_9APHY